MSEKVHVITDAPSTEPKTIFKKHLAYYLAGAAALVVAGSVIVSKMNQDSDEDVADDTTSPTE